MWIKISKTFYNLDKTKSITITNDSVMIDNIKNTMSGEEIKSIEEKLDKLLLQ